jgi:hypothetical protein
MIKVSRFPMLLVAGGTAVLSVTASKPVAAQPAESYGNLPLSFEANHGQYGNT